MARDKLTEYSATASENTVCGDVNIAENSALPSDLNNYAREIMSHLKNFSDGTDAIDALTVTGDLTVDTNTLVVDAANNRVEIGASDNEGTLRFGDNATYYGEIKRVNASDELRIGHYGSSQNVTFYTAGSERGRFLAGGGLTFNGDTAAANALDDYEESTYSFAERNGQATLTTHRCRVVKIGALVYIDGSFTVGSTSNTNPLNINLPFASTIGNNGLGGGCIGFSNLSTSIIEANLRPNVENLADNLFFRYGSNNLVTCTAASGKRIDFNVWYPVL